MVVNRIDVSKLRKIVNFTPRNPAYILAVEGQDVALKSDNFFSFKSFTRQVKAQLGIVFTEFLSEETWAQVRKALHSDQENINVTPEIKCFFKERGV